MKEEKKTICPRCISDSRTWCSLCSGIEKYTMLPDEIYTEEPKRNRSDFWWWFALVIMVSYFAGHLLLAIIR